VICTQGIISSGSALLGGFMPDDEVLRRSDFAAPLTPQTQALYTRIMASL